jgi:hypothetical protein
MDVSMSALVQRVRTARAGVVAAVAAHDPAAVSLAVDELEDALRAARQQGVDVPAEQTDVAIEQEWG